MSAWDLVRVVVLAIWIVVLVRFGITAWRRQRWGGIALTIGVWLISGVLSAMGSAMLTALVGLRLAWDIGGPLAIAAGVEYWRRQLAAGQVKT